MHPLRYHEIISLRLENIASDPINRQYGVVLDDIAPTLDNVAGRLQTRDGWHPDAARDAVYHAAIIATKRRRLNVWKCIRTAVHEWYPHTA